LEFRAFNRLTLGSYTRLGEHSERIVARSIDARMQPPERLLFVFDSPSVLNERTSRSLRIDVEKLDVLLNLAGEVALAQGRLADLVDEAAAAHDALAAFQDQLQALQQSVMRLRVVPLGPTFERFRRAIHTLAQRVGKQIALSVEGGDVEVDVTLAEALRDPLMHMLRNAVDHGIESPEQRFAAGKFWPGVSR
jgi:two-component system chemotaxis sensor kinase CheA